MEEEVLVPESRIAVLIGKNGETRRKIEYKTKTGIAIDSETGAVTVKGNSENAMGFYNALGIIKAVARGFSPENAFLLSRKGYLLELLKISDYIGKNPSLQKAKRGRIIGRQGRAREKIEKKTGCKISVQGKTIAIIGKQENIEKARNAIEILLGGAKHETAFHMLDEKEQPKKFEI